MFAKRDLLFIIIIMKFRILICAYYLLRNECTDAFIFVWYLTHAFQK